MVYRFNYLLDGSVVIDGKKIRFKVTGEDAHDQKPFVIVVAGGPGLSHHLTTLYMSSLLPIAAQQQDALPHFILFDNPGCGESDPSQSPEVEYTIDYFTEIAACLVEKIKHMLRLKRLSLYVDGTSFGGMVALNFPVIRPGWLEPDSDISLKQITAKVMPNGPDIEDYTFQFLQTHHRAHPNYDTIVQAQRKLIDGAIEDSADYIRHFVLPMASLYDSSATDSYLKSALLKMLHYAPETTLSILNTMIWFLDKLGIEAKDLRYMTVMLGECSIPVLNHFNANKFNGFNLINTVAANLGLYQKIPIALIAASNDHIVDSSTAITLHELLGSNSALFVFEGSHALSRGSAQSIYNQLNYGLLVSGRLTEAVCSGEMMSTCQITDSFRDNLAFSHQRASSSTACMLASMPSSSECAESPATDEYVCEEKLMPSRVDSEYVAATTLALQ